MLNPKRIEVNKQYPLAAQTLSQMFTVKKTEVTVIQFLGNDDMGPNKKGTNSKKNLSYWIPVKKNKVDVITKVKPKATATTFQVSLRATILIGQAFSLIPVIGIMSNKATDVKFSKKSLKVIYSIISFIGQMFMTAMCLYKIIVDTTLKNTTPVIFYGTTFISMVMFFQMGLRWPNLVQHISKAEEMGPNYDSRLTYRCNITCGVVLTLAFFEHILSLLSAFAGALVCHDNLNLYEGFVRHFYPWVFDVLPYSPALGIVTQFLHFQSTFIWNFSDLFVICMSYYLTSCLEEINKKLLDAQGKYLPEIFWRRIREDYGRACQIVRRVDDVISGIIFISFANNLFFICLQLFNTLEDGIKGTGECSSRTAPSSTHLLGGYEAAAYFVFSLAFLIGRSVAVSLIASQVNSASNVPAPVLYDVPSPVYCVEVQRFLDQVNGDKVALTGLQFFSVTRGLLLTVAGTIVTYELVMFQFNSPSGDGVGTPSSPLNVTTSIPFTTSS